VDNYPLFDIKAAQLELSKKRLTQIEFETAAKWYARAFVAYTNFTKTKDIRWYLDGDTYENEAIEHGAFVEGKNTDVLKDIRSKVAVVRKEAELIVKKKSFV
jgi:hypothetical protein